MLSDFLRVSSKDVGNGIPTYGEDQGSFLCDSAAWRDAQSLRIFNLAAATSRMQSAPTEHEG
jgi:hypothetical protein